MSATLPAVNFGRKPVPHNVTCQDVRVPSSLAAEESGICIKLCCLHACSCNDVCVASHHALGCQGHGPTCMAFLCHLHEAKWLASLQVCDQPHPLLVAQIVKDCARCKLDEAYKGMKVRLSRRSHLHMVHAQGSGRSIALPHVAIMEIGRGIYVGLITSQVLLCYA